MAAIFETRSSAGALVTFTQAVGYTSAAVGEKLAERQSFTAFFSIVPCRRHRIGGHWVRQSRFRWQQLCRRSCGDRRVAFRQRLGDVRGSSVQFRWSGDSGCQADRQPRRHLRQQRPATPVQAIARRRRHYGCHTAVRYSDTGQPATTVTPRSPLLGHTQATSPAHNTVAPVYDDDCGCNAKPVQPAATATPTVATTAVGKTQTPATPQYRYGHASSHGTPTVTDTVGRTYHGSADSHDQTDCHEYRRTSRHPTKPKAATKPTVSGTASTGEDGDDAQEDASRRLRIQLTIQPRTTAGPAAMTIRDSLNDPRFLCGLQSRRATVLPRGPAS